ncbi:MAG: glycosyltransferase [Candidatus Parcubacteria bacterium]|nr:glycosyltransferase [Candidatus Parcubacteria bacterium]
MNLGKKFGIRCGEDFLYATATLIMAIYVFLILGITFLDGLGIHIAYSSRLVLKPLDAQFPFLLTFCIIVMYSSVFIWVFMGIASFFYKKKPNKITTSTSTLVSVLIPAHNEEAVVKNILSDLLSQSYQNIEIIVIAHNCDDSTVEMARSIYDQRIKVFDYHTTKSGKALALNYGLQFVHGQVIAQFDTDNRIPDPLLFNRAMFYFKNSDIDAVQGALSTSNTQESLLTFLQEVEYDVFSCISWQGRDALKLPCFLAGTGIFITTKTIKEVGGWSNSLVEDFELFTRLTLQKKKIIYADNIVVYDEKPSTWTAIMKQRSRWVKGHLGVTWNNLGNFGNWLDYLYRLSPLSVFAWWLSNFLYIYYFLTGQVSLMNVNGWLWIGWSFLFFTFMVATTWRKRGFKRIFALPIYWIFGFHWLFVTFYSLGVHSWEDTKTVHFGKSTA